MYHRHPKFDPHFSTSSNDIRVSFNISLAIDRDVIVKELWRGRGIVPSGPIAKGDNHFDPSLPPLAYNPKAAPSASASRSSRSENG